MSNDISSVAGWQERSGQEVEHHNSGSTSWPQTLPAYVEDWKEVSTTNLSGVKQSDPALHPHEDKEKNVCVCVHVYTSVVPITYGDCVHTCRVRLSACLSVQAHLYEVPWYDHTVDSR